MDVWGWTHLDAWVKVRVTLPVGPLFCVLDGPTRGRVWTASQARGELAHLAAKAGVRRRFAPHHYADPMVMPRRARKSAHVGMMAVLMSA
jgi:hypothetical protein